MKEIIKAPITLVIIAHNAADKLKAVVEHHRPYVSEVVICDQGSTDNTYEVASEIADLVVKRRCKGYSDPDRDWAYSIGNQPYILAMDDDEFLSQEALDALPDLIGAGIEAIWFKRANFVDEINISPSFGDDPQCRLWKRGTIFWPSQMHTFPSVKGPTATVLFSNLWMNHYRTLEGLKKANYSRNSVAPPQIREMQDLFVQKVERYLAEQRATNAK